MPISDYQLFVNIPQGPKEKVHIIRSIEFVLIDVFIKPAVRMTQRGKYVDPQARQYLESKEHIRILVRQLMKEKGWDPVPDRTPFYLGMVILNSSGHKCDLDNLIKTVGDALQGVLFKNDCWCDGISVIRPPQEGKTNDARITVSWKETISPSEVSNGRMGNN